MNLLQALLSGKNVRPEWTKDLFRKRNGDRKRACDGRRCTKPVRDARKAKNRRRMAEASRRVNRQRRG